MTCDPITQRGCAFGSDGLTLTTGTYCIPDDNYACLSDQGELCNSTSTQPWCNIYNNTDSCLTLDGYYCFDYWKYYCLTYDGINCTANESYTG